MMFFAGNRWPGEIHIALAVMDGPVDRDPSVHTYWEEHVPWVQLGDTLPRRGGPTGIEPLEADG